MVVCVPRLGLADRRGGRDWMGWRGLATVIISDSHQEIVLCVAAALWFILMGCFECQDATRAGNVLSGGHTVICCSHH